jgi:hypothetical protein
VPAKGKIVLNMALTEFLSLNQFANKYLYNGGHKKSGQTILQ